MKKVLDGQYQLFNIEFSKKVGYNLDKNILKILFGGKMEKEYNETLEMEVSKEFVWEVMANFRRLGSELENNIFVNKLYNKIGDDSKRLPNMSIEEMKIYDRKNNLLYSQSKTPEINPETILEKEFTRKWREKKLKNIKKILVN